MRNRNGFQLPALDRPRRLQNAVRSSQPPGRPGNGVLRLPAGKDPTQDSLAGDSSFRRRPGPLPRPGDPFAVAWGIDSQGTVLDVQDMALGARTDIRYECPEVVLPALADHDAPSSEVAPSGMGLPMAPSNHTLPDMPKIVLGLWDGIWFLGSVFLGHVSPCGAGFSRHRNYSRKADCSRKAD